MKPEAVFIAISVVLSACTPAPVVVSQAPVLLVDWSALQECRLIRGEIARQERIAAYSGVMATALVEASVRLNVANVISGLQTRAALAGCPA